MDGYRGVVGKGIRAGTGIAFDRANNLMANDKRFPYCERTHASFVIVMEIGSTYSSVFYADKYFTCVWYRDRALFDLQIACTTDYDSVH